MWLKEINADTYCESIYVNHIGHHQKVLEIMTTLSTDITFQRRAMAEVCFNKHRMLALEKIW